MKIFLIAICGIVLGLGAVTGSPASGRETTGVKKLGAKECTWGPTYWCENFSNAKACRANKHCIQTVWEKKTYPEDTDDICTICKNMVEQARDQLESNETQTDLKAVFEGSCHLIPIKIVDKECCRLADDFIPQLIEALASQMNPNTVCSVAGLCNNVRYDKLIEEYNSKPKEGPQIEDLSTKAPAVIAPKSNVLSCTNCGVIATHITDKFQSKNRDDILEQLLRFCGKFSSFSDACSNIMITYFNDIYKTMQDGINKDSICHMSGVCAANYHQHEDEVEVRPMSNVGFVAVSGTNIKEDIPCELCEQLVNHLRDLLIANTTELEFKSVMEGLCKQTGGFKTECISIVDQYYDEIYNTLVNNLDSNGACYMIGVCPKGSNTMKDDQSKIMPIVPADKNLDHIKTEPKKKFILGANEPKLTATEIQNAQLPIDQLLGAPNSFQLVEGGTWCTFCEYALHYVQETLSLPKNEDEIKKALEDGCSQLPKSVQGKCRDFIGIYGDAIMAMLIQEIDPSQVCPTLKLCPSGKVIDVETFSPEVKPPPKMDVTIKSSDKPTCPLCLFAVQELQQIIETNKTKENVEDALKGLCSHLPAKLRNECNDFVETYSAELIEMLISDFTPQEICVYLRLCSDQSPDLSLVNLKLGMDKADNIEMNGDIETNEIPDDTINGQLITSVDTEYESTPECLVCQQMIKEIEKRVINKKSKEQIKNALEHACDRLHKFKSQCRKYIENHEERIIDLILKEVTPKEICRDLQLCLRADELDLEVDESPVVVNIIAAPNKNAAPVEDTPQCAVCELVMTQIEKELNDKPTQDEIKNAVKHVCIVLPKSIRNECDKMIDQYGTMIILLLSTTPPKEICSQMMFCGMKKLESSKTEVVECAVCQGAVKSLDILLKNKKVDDEIEVLLEKSCNSIPAQYNERCTEMVKYYGMSMINILEQMAETHTVCAKIGMCYPDQFGLVDMTDDIASDDEIDSADATSTTKPKLVGANPCLWGPSYWCANKQNAEDCKTVSFCTEKKLTGKW